MGGQACKVKIILNGGTIESEVHALCYQIQESDISDEVGYEIVEYLNHAENLIFGAKHIFLKSQGFNGPWPHSLSFKSDYKPD